MSDTNLSRDKKKNQQKLNSAAFIEILGDNETEGIYNLVKRKHNLEHILGHTVDQFELIDFCCDVEKVLDDLGLSTKKLTSTNKQKIGKLFRERKLYPIKKYFKAQ